MATKIEWTGETWNPVTGCTQLSAGCKNCYAKTIALQMQKDGVKRYENGFNVTTQKICSVNRDNEQSQQLFSYARWLTFSIRTCRLNL